MTRQQRTNYILKLRSAGHPFGSSTTTSEIEQAYEAFVEVLKIVPESYHVGMASKSQGLDLLKLAMDLNLKVAFWSTTI
jgi:hypothetical protein